MRKEYDFSQGERGKFYTKDARFNLPVYLDDEVFEYLENLARKRSPNSTSAPASTWRLKDPSKLYSNRSADTVVEYRKQETSASVRFSIFGSMERAHLRGMLSNLQYRDHAVISDTSLAFQLKL